MYILITLLLGFSAVNTGNNLLFLVVAGLLAFMSVTGLAGMINIKGLTPDVLPPAEIFAGTVTPFIVRVHNRKRRIPSFIIRVECSNAASVTIPVIPADSAIEASIPMKFPARGPASIVAITVSSPFPVDFFTRYWTFAVDTGFIVYPGLQPCSLSGVGDEMQPTGNSAHTERGHDGELEKIAGYSGREPLRVIHWKLSARSNDLQVKEFGRQSSVPLVIDLDALAGTGQEDRISRAAWLVRRWVNLRPVGLKLGGRIIDARSGQRHGTRLLTELATYDLN